MKRFGCLAAAALAAAVLLWFAGGWWMGSSVERDAEFTVAEGATLTSAAAALKRTSAIGSRRLFLLRAKVLGSGDGIQAGEFLLPAGASEARILDILQHGRPLRRLVTIPEGMPSILVWEKLMAERLLTGAIAVRALRRKTSVITITTPSS